MADGARRPATYADLERVADHKVAEIIGGELVVSPRPRARHALSASSLGAELVQGFGGRGRPGGLGGWWILFEPELHLGLEVGRRRARDEVLVPDLAGWRRERMPSVPDVPGLELSPDWVCEVLSPSTASVDRILKMDVYARVGVGHVWLVDPDARTLEVFRLQDGLMVRVSGHAGSGRVRAEPFQALELWLGRWWGEDEGPVGVADAPEGAAPP